MRRKGTRRGASRVRVSLRLARVEGPVAVDLSPADVVSLPLVDVVYRPLAVAVNRPLVDAEDSAAASEAEGRFHHLEATGIHRFYHAMQLC